MTTRLIGELQLSRKLAELRAKTLDMRAALGHVRDDLIDFESRRFGSEARPVSRSYAEWKMIHYPGTRPLVLTGRLRNAMLGRSSEYRQHLQPLSLLIEILTPYAGVHARAAAPIGRAELERWTAIVEQHLVDAAKV